MKAEPYEIFVKGKPVTVPSVCVEQTRVIVQGKGIKMASVHDEEWIEGELVKDPASFIGQLKKQGLNADVFTFGQKVPDTSPKYSYHMDWDNVAAIPIASFEDWWENRLPQVSRKNVRRSEKRGVTVRPVKFDDQLVAGMLEIFRETLVKQGIPFAHHGKDFATVKAEHGTMLNRSEFIGAYHGDELIGFVKLVYMGKIASVLNIIGMDKHYDKRPTNALIAKAVEVCAQKGMTHLLYGKFTYGRKTNSSLREFKYRNGFEEIRYPRYYVPLTLRGRIFVSLKLYRGLLGTLPPGAIAFLLKSRAAGFRVWSRISGSASAASSAEALRAEPEPNAARGVGEAG
jgi:hypothetical protein